MPRRPRSVVPLLAVIVAASGLPTVAMGQSPAPRIEEVKPEIFYLEDDARGLVPVPGFRYEDFVEMLRLKEGLPRGPQPPPAVISSVVVEGEIDGNECPATVRLKVVQSEAGWVGVPLALDGFRLTAPPVHEGKKRFLIDAENERPGGYRGWFEGRVGDEHMLSLRGVFRVDRAKDQEAVSVDLPRASASRISVRTAIEEAVVAVDPPRVEPRVERAGAGALAEPDLDGDEPADGPPRTEPRGSLITLVGVAGPTRILVRGPGAVASESAAAPQAIGEIAVRIDGRRAVSDVALELRGLPAGMRTVSVRLPARASVVAVRPPSTLVETKGGEAGPEAVFAVDRDASGNAPLRFECETPAEGGAVESLAYRVAGIADWRQWGRISILIDGDWQVNWGPVPANRRVDPPASLDNGQCIGAFAYDSQPARLPLQVRPLGSRVVIEPEYGYSVGGARIELDARLRVSVRGRPITEIELALDGWGIDAVGPSSLVDADAITGAGGKLTIPFVKPLTGNGTVEIRAARTIAKSDERVSWTLPVPKANLVGPASVTIVSDSDIELVPDGDVIRGLVRQAASGRGGDSTALAYRLEGTEGAFAAARRFLPRRIDATISAHALVDRSDMVVDETIRYDVAHVPLASVSLAVPRSVYESGGLEVRYQETLLNLRESAEPSSGDSGDSGADVEPSPPAVVRLLAELPSPRLGSVELKIRYSLKTPEVPVEATVAEDLPIVTPLEGKVARQSFSVESQAGLAVDVRGDQWKRDVSIPGGTASRSWTSAKPQEFVPIALAAERQTAAASSIVEAAWLETRVLPDRREDRFRYRIDTTAPTIQLTLPGEPAANAVEVSLDGRSVVGGIQPGGRIVVEIPAGGSLGEHLLEIERVQPRPAFFEPLVLEAPQFGDRTQQRRFYWEVRLETDEHVVVAPRRWTSQQGWAWSGLGFVRRPVVSRESLARWVNARLEEETFIDEERSMPAVVGRRDVYSGIGWPGREAVWILPTWLMVALVSGPILLGGLAVVYRPASRAVPLAVTLGATWAALAIAAPDLSPLAVQYAVPGLALSVMAAGLRMAVAPRAARGIDAASSRVIISGSSTRTVALPSLLIGAGSSASGKGLVETLLLAIVLAAAGGTTARAEETLRFLRVRVPDEKAASEMLGGARYVPMPLAEFDEAVSRAEPSSPEPGHRMPTLQRVAYRLSWQPGHGLVGTVEFDVERGFDRYPFVVPIGGLAIEAATVETEEGTGVATVAGLPDGRVGVFVRQPGRYRCRGSSTSVARSAGPEQSAVGASYRVHSIRFPLPRAIATTIELAVPEGIRPVVEGGLATVERDDGDDLSGWRYRIVPRAVESLPIRFEQGSTVVPLEVINRLSVARRQWSLEAVVEPRRPWQDEALILRVDPGLSVTAVSLRGEGAIPGGPLLWSIGDDGGSIRVLLPRGGSGGRAAVVVSAVAPLERTAAATRAPIVRPVAEAWASGRMIVSLDESTTFRSVEVENAAIVATREPSVARQDAENEPLPQITVEQQSVEGAAMVAVADRVPEIDTARVTTVDISSGAVTARSMANVRVGRGEVFELKARIGPEWLVDSVEIPGEAVPLDWGVERSSPGSILRVGLVRGIAPGRELSLRVVGHRAVLPQGRAFPASSLDMVRFDGESEGQSLIDVRTNAETTILVGGIAEAARDADGMPQRIRSLLEPGPPRARLPAGELAKAGEVTTLRRRPPVDVQTRIHVTSREERLTESFTFECAPRDSEIDSLVVFLSESAESPPEWSVLAPSSSKVSARRIEAEPRRDQGDSGRSLAAESWLVEIAPPVREPVSIRATRTMPFAGPRRVALAWVEGAPTRGGEIFVRDAGRGRPTVTATRLPEMPGRAASSERAGMPVASFTFDAARDLAPGGPPPLEIAPAADPASNARAWVWSETTTTWCDESGSTEYETSFVIENHGRSGVTLDLPPDKRLEGVLVDGARLQAMGSDAAGGQIAIELPSGRRFVRLDLRLVAESRPFWGCWTVNASAGRLDLPVLERSWLLGLPPQLEIAMASARHRLTDARVPSWSGRLLGISPSRERAPYGLHRFVPVDGGADEASVTLVRSTAVWRAAIAVAALGLAAGWWLAPKRFGTIWFFALVCGLAVLWSAAPWYGLARSLLSGLFAGAAVRLAGRRGIAIGAAAAVLMVAAETRAADPRPPERVFIAPGDSGPIALVPESIFRAIAAADRAPASRAVGVVRTRLEARGSHSGDDARWQLEAELDAEAGGRLVVEQPGQGARFVAGSASLDGTPLADAVSADGRSLAVVIDGFGRRLLRVELRPAFESAGGIEEAVLALPAAARSTVALPAEWVSGGGWPHECEWSGGGMAGDRRWNFAERTSDDGIDPTVFDVTGGTAVRISRAKRRGVSIVRRPAAVSCLQEIEWGERECLVRVSIEAQASPNGAEDRICRSLDLDVDPRLVAIEDANEGDDGFVARIGPNGRGWIEWTKPDASTRRASLAFRMPFSSPVGIFQVPLVGPAGGLEATTDVRLRTAAPGLRVAADLPASVRPVPPRGDDVVGRYVGWTTRAVGERVSIGVSRREIPLQVVQTLSVSLERDRARLRLDARVGTAAATLAELRVAVPAACIVDSVRLTAVDAATEGSADTTPVDVGFLRERPDRLKIIVQRPREGRYRLSLQARLLGPLSASGRLPVARVLASGADPLEIVVSAPDDAAISLGDGKETVTQATLQLAADAPAPPFRLVERRRTEEDDGAAAAGGEANAATAAAHPEKPADGTPPAVGDRVELADVRLAIDDRGRAWGVVRFELMTGQPLLRLRLPAGFRLFDVFVDEHPAVSRPADDGGWEVRLLDVSRPRSLVAVFLGELGDRVASGDAIELAAPEIGSLPAADVLWTIRGPRDRAIRFLSASGESSAQAVVTARARAIDRLTADVVRAFEGRNPEEQARIRTYLDRDESSDSAAPEAAWDRSSLALAPNVFFVAGGKDSSIRFRIARQRDPTLPGRIVGTLCLAAAIGVAWRVGRGIRAVAA